MSVYLDSASEFSLRRLRRLAKRAYRARQHGEAALARLSTQSGVSPRQLRLLADAWAAGGAAGIGALAPAASRMPDEELREVDTTLESWRNRHYPLETLQWEVWRNRVTVWQVVPGPDRLGPADRLPVLQLRRTPDESWHLYRKAVRGEWWPVIVTGPPHATTLTECLDAVRLDVARQFWPPPAVEPRLPRQP